MNGTPTTQRLKKWLDRKGETQRWLADQLGISEPQMSMILSGARGVSLQMAVRIESLTGIPARDFAKAS